MKPWNVLNQLITSVDISLITTLWLPMRLQSNYKWLGIWDSFCRIRILFKVSLGIIHIMIQSVSNLCNETWIIKRAWLWKELTFHLLMLIVCRIIAKKIKKKQGISLTRINKKAQFLINPTQRLKKNMSTVYQVKKVILLCCQEKRLKAQIQRKSCLNKRKIRIKTTKTRKKKLI